MHSFSMPKGLVIFTKALILCKMCSFGWIVGFQLADWDSHIFGHVLSFDLSS